MIQSERVHIKMITYTGQILKQPKNNEVIEAHNKKNRINILQTVKRLVIYFEETPHTLCLMVKISLNYLHQDQDLECICI